MSKIAEDLLKKINIAIQDLKTADSEKIKNIIKSVRTPLGRHELIVDGGAKSGTGLPYEEHNDLEIIYKFYVCLSEALLRNKQSDDGANKVLLDLERWYEANIAVFGSRENVLKEAWKVAKKRKAPDTADEGSEQPKTKKFKTDEEKKKTEASVASVSSREEPEKVPAIRVGPQYQAILPPGPFLGAREKRMLEARPLPEAKILSPQSQKGDCSLEKANVLLRKFLAVLSIKKRFYKQLTVAAEAEAKEKKKDDINYLKFQDVNSVFENLKNIISELHPYINGSRTLEVLIEWLDENFFEHLPFEEEGDIEKCIRLLSDKSLKKDIKEIQTELTNYFNELSPPKEKKEAGEGLGKDVFRPSQGSLSLPLSQVYVDKLKRENAEQKDQIDRLEEESESLSSALQEVQGFFEDFTRLISNHSAPHLRQVSTPLVPPRQSEASHQDEQPEESSEEKIEQLEERCRDQEEQIEQLTSQRGQFIQQLEKKEQTTQLRDEAWRAQLQKLQEENKKLQEENKKLQEVTQIHYDNRYQYTPSYSYPSYPSSFYSSSSSYSYDPGMYRTPLVPPYPYRPSIPPASSSPYAPVPSASAFRATVDDDVSEVIKDSALADDLPGFASPITKAPPFAPFVSDDEFWKKVESNPTAEFIKAIRQKSGKSHKIMQRHSAAIKQFFSKYYQQIDSSTLALLCSFPEIVSDICNDQKIFLYILKKKNHLTLDAAIAVINTLQKHNMQKERDKLFSNQSCTTYFSNIIEILGAQASQKYQEVLYEILKINSHFLTLPLLESMECENFFNHPVLDRRNLQACRQEIKDILINKKHELEGSKKLPVKELKMSSIMSQSFFSRDSSQQQVDKIIQAQVQEQKQRLQNAALQYGYDCIDMPRDGWCLLSAIVPQLKIATLAKVDQRLFVRGADEAKVKKRLHESIIKHFDHYFDDYRQQALMDKEKFMALLKNYDRNWASEVGDLLPLAIARILKVDVCIVPGTGANPTIIKVPNPHSVLLLGHEVGCHYQQLKRKQSFKAQKDLEVLYENASVDTWLPLESRPQASSSSTASLKR